MTKHLFDVSVTTVKDIYDMPGTWSDDDYRQILTALEVDGVEEISASDLPDMTIMALQDMEVEDAADVVLAHKLLKRISAGSRRNIIEDLLDGQRSWEEVADIKLHALLFAASVLLHKAFPKHFMRPDMMQVVFEVCAATPEAAALLLKNPQAAFVARMLADALSENCILERLFDEQLLGNSFPEAEGIIWHAEFIDHSITAQTSASLVIYSSDQWLKDIEPGSKFQSNAYNDSDHGDNFHGRR